MNELKTEAQVVAFVQGHADYFEHGYRLPHGELGGKYAANYAGRVYHHDDTRALVEMICFDNKITYEVSAVVPIGYRQIGKKTEMKFGDLMFSRQICQWVPIYQTYIGKTLSYLANSTNVIRHR